MGQLRQLALTAVAQWPDKSYDERVNMLTELFRKAVEDECEECAHDAQAWLLWAEEGKEIAVTPDHIRTRGKTRRKIGK